MFKYNKTAFIVYGLYLVHIFAGNLITSVHAVYLLSKGITYFQLNSLTSIVLFLGILLEVPTGIIGDRFGHKVSFQLSMFLGALRRACIPLVSSFDALVILAVVSAISDACWSGSFTAWYMASLKVKGTDAENVNLFSNLNIVASILLLKKENSTTVILGIAWTMIRSGTLVSAVISKKLSSYRKYYRLFKFALILLSTAALLGMAYTKSWFIGAFCFSLHAMVWVTFSALNSGVLYSHIPDKAKATILSATSMIYSLAGIIGLSLFGLIADKNLTFTFTIAAVSMCAILFTVFIDKNYEKN